MPSSIIKWSQKNKANKYEAVTLPLSYDFIAFLYLFQYFAVIVLYDPSCRHIYILPIAAVQVLYYHFTCGRT